VIQWEDLSKTAAFTVLERYRDRGPSFNDDIQGTGAVALAGILAACHLRKESLKDEVFVIHGAGAGGVGVAWAVREGLVRAGLSRADAKARVFVLDSQGLLLADRDMEQYKQDFAHERASIRGWEFQGDSPDLVETIRNAKATVLLGLSGRPGAFDEAVVRAMADNHKWPIIFPLSNPTSSAEATPIDIFRWTDGQAIVATGSPFDPVMMGGVTHPIGQGNNAFIFPGLGFGAILSDAKAITDGMVLEASQALAEYTIEKYVDGGLIYPPVSDLQETSVRVATRVVKQAIADGVARRENIPDDIEAFVRQRFWHPTYLPFVRGHQD
jgi:malate dehydrogenase (oxaloacetate-decarboxylating)